MATLEKGNRRGRTLPSKGGKGVGGLFWTVVDCFKYRNKVGLDAALEALRDYRRQHRAEMDELWYFANTCRVARVMQPYLEALA